MNAPDTATRATLAVRLTDELREQLRAITQQVAPLSRRGAIAPAVEMLARRVTASWPSPRAVLAAHDQPAGRPFAVDVTPDARAHLTAVATARDVDDGLLLRAAIAAFAAKMQSTP